MANETDIEFPEGYNGWIEPDSLSNQNVGPEYPYNKVIQTRSGHIVELDDTPGRERVRVTHRMGSFIEMRPNGDVVHKSFGDNYEITIGNKNVSIDGVCNITVLGDAIFDIKGNKTERVAGDYNIECGGKFTAYAHGEAALISDVDVRVSAGTELYGGDVNLTAGGRVVTTSDLSVEGSITGQIITSVTRMNAGTGVYAGPLGFVSILGGLSIGVPAAVPMTINCIGLINASVMNSASANHLLGTSILGISVINDLLYDGHIHVTKVGPTTPTPMQAVA